MIGVGAHQTGSLEGNLTYCFSSGEYGAALSLRVAEGGFYDARIKLGDRISEQNARAFGIRSNGFNDIGVYDSISPLGIGDYSYFGAVGCGSKFGADIRYRTEVAYVDLAFGIGSFVLNPGVHRNMETDTTGARLGVVAHIGDAELWPQVRFEQGQKPRYSLMVSAGF